VLRIPVFLSAREEDRSAAGSARYLLANKKYLLKLDAIYDTILL